MKRVEGSPQVAASIKKICLKMGCLPRYFSLSSKARVALFILFFAFASLKPVFKPFLLQKIIKKINTKQATCSFSSKYPRTLQHPGSLFQPPPVMTTPLPVSTFVTSVVTTSLLYFIILSPEYKSLNAT